MSHWISGKLDLVCSLAILRRALLNIMPEWEQFMETAEGGSLSINNYHTNKTMGGYDLKVNLKQGGQRAPGFQYADIGFKKNADGTWSTDIDETYIRINGVQTLQGAIQREVGAMKAQAIARQVGGRTVGVRTSGGRTKVKMHVPQKEAYRLRA